MSVCGDEDRAGKPLSDEKLSVVIFKNDIENAIEDTLVILPVTEV